MSKFLSFIVLTVATLLGCSDDSQGSLQTKHEPLNAKSTNMQQPSYLTFDKGIKYPYFRYVTKEGEGWAMFIHPIFEAKNRVLALIFKRGDVDLRRLFNTELFGNNFLIIKKNGFLEVEDDAFLFYRPLNINDSWNRNVTYAREEFECRLIFQYSEEYKIQCISSSYTFNFVFNSERGVTSFQDFSDYNDIYTYDLVSDAGILSPYHLQSMGF